MSGDGVGGAAGSGLGTALAASGNPSALLSGLGSAVGISGNIGVTQRTHLVERPDGSYSQHADALHGFAGGVDVVGASQRSVCLTVFMRDLF